MAEYDEALRPVNIIADCDHHRQYQDVIVIHSRLEHGHPIVLAKVYLPSGCDAIALPIDSTTSRLLAREFSDVEPGGLTGAELPGGHYDAWRCFVLSLIIRVPLVTDLACAAQRCWSGFTPTCVPIG